MRNIESASAKAIAASLALKLLDPRLPHFQRWATVMSEPTDNNFLFPQFISDPGAESCILLAYLAWYGLDEEAQIFLEWENKPVLLKIPLVVGTKFTFEKELQMATKQPSYQELCSFVEEANEWGNRCPETTTVLHT